MSRSPRGTYVPLAARAAQFNRAAERAEELKRALQRQLQRLEHLRRVLLAQDQSELVHGRLGELAALVDRISELKGLTPEQLNRVPKEVYQKLKAQVDRYLADALQDADDAIDRIIGQGPSLEELQEKADDLAVQSEMFRKPPARRWEGSDTEDDSDAEHAAELPSCGSRLVAALRYVLCCGCVRDEADEVTLKDDGYVRAPSSPGSSES